MQATEWCVIIKIGKVNTKTECTHIFFEQFGHSLWPTGMLGMPSFSNIFTGYSNITAELSSIVMFSLITDEEKYFRLHLNAKQMDHFSCDDGNWRSSSMS